MAKPICSVPLSAAGGGIKPRGVRSTRNRKLLLNQRELDSLYGRVNREGYTVVALSLYWKTPGQTEDWRGTR